MVGPFPAFRNINVDKIRDEGVELLGDVRLAGGLGARASFSTHSAEDARNFLCPHVTPQTGPTHAFQSRDRARSVDQLVSNFDPRMRRAPIQFVIGNVAFIFQNSRDLRFDFRVRHT